MKRLIVFSGAGMSAESGIPTFRGSDGLWENHRLEDVATPEAWERDPVLVLEFYNQRRKAVLEAQPNEGHQLIARWQDEFDVTVITQNIDDLHERAGSTNVLHLHGEIRKSRSTANSQLVYPIENWQLHIGDMCENGAQLRPHIVWFGEDVPMLEIAANKISEADIFLVVGTSLQVYPAAGLVHYALQATQKFIVDPQANALLKMDDWRTISMGAGEGLRLADAELLR
jgi:NAD-dependent deacetylase